MEYLKIIFVFVLALYSLYSYINEKSKTRIVSPLILIFFILLINFKGDKVIKITSEKISLNQVKELVANS